MSEPAGNEILVEPKRLFCSSHGEHLRAQWPKGFAIIGVRMFQAAAENPELQKLCGWVDGQQDALPERINDVTATKTIRRLFREAGILSVVRCDLCGLTGDAGPRRHEHRIRAGCFPRAVRSLHEIAPRLARARDQLVAERTAARAWRRWHGDRELHLLWLVSHRELQLERANATGRGRYIDVRRRKLAQARVELAAHQALVYQDGIELERAA